MDRSPSEHRQKATPVYQNISLVTVNSLYQPERLLPIVGILDLATTAPHPVPIESRGGTLTSALQHHTSFSTLMRWHALSVAS